VQVDAQRQKSAVARRCGVMLKEASKGGDCDGDGDGDGRACVCVTVLAEV